MMTLMTKELIKLGLNKREAQVYLALLELGTVGISQIAKKMNANRTTLYGALDGLVEKDLVRISILGKRKVYSAQSPKMIEDILKKRLSVAGELVPQLLSLENTGATKPTFRYLDGVEGIKTAFRDSLSAKNKTIVGFSGVEALTQKNKGLLRFWEKEYMPTRKKKNVLVKLVMPDGKMGKYMKKNDQRDLRESRLVPESSYDFKSEIYVWDDVVAFTSYSQGEEFALQIESQPIADTVRMIFQIVWNQAY